MSDVTIQNVQDSIGHDTEERCPECNANIVENNNGCKWCSGVDCRWSNEPEFTEWLKKEFGSAVKEQANENN